MSRGIPAGATPSRCCDSVTKSLKVSFVGRAGTAYHIAEQPSASWKLRAMSVMFWSVHTMRVSVWSAQSPWRGGDTLLLLVAIVASHLGLEQHAGRVLLGLHLYARLLLGDVRPRMAVARATHIGMDGGAEAGAAVEPVVVLQLVHLDAPAVGDGRGGQGHGRRGASRRQSGRGLRAADGRWDGWLDLGREGRECGRAGDERGREAAMEAGGFAIGVAKSRWFGAG
jgi:hypothetical protein